MDPLVHTWSLGVEEQFYFAWPFLLMLALRCGGVRGLVGLTLLLSFPLAAWQTRVNQPYAFFLSPLRGWEFALGAAGVVWSDRLQHVRGAFLAAAGLGAIIGSALLFDDGTPFPGFAALLPTFGTVLVLVATSDDDNAVRRALSHPVLTELGRLSYSWYLWHWPFLVFAPVVLGRPQTTFEGIVAALLALVVAKLSHRFWEEPIRRLPSLAKNARSFALATCLVAVGITSSIGLFARRNALLRDPLFDALTLAAESKPMEGKLGRCHLTKFQSSIHPEDCTFGTAGTPHVVLIGDSHAQQWFPALQAAADRGLLTVTSLTKSSCPPISKTVVDHTLKRPYHECTSFMEEVASKLPSLEPDLVLLGAFSRPNIAGEEWREGLDLLVSSALATGAGVGLLRDVPWQPESSNVCLARAHMLARDLDDCAFLPVAHGHFNSAIESIAAGRQRVDVVDTWPLACGEAPSGTCRVMDDSLPVWRDNNHLSAPFTRASSAAFVDLLQPLLGRR